MGNLKRKGLLGWSQSQPGGERANPLAAGFQRAIGQQDEELALKAFGEGTAEQDRLARFQQQMFGQAKQPKKSSSLSALKSISGLLKDEISDAQLQEMLKDIHR
jgi:hypothetical protein